MLFPNVTGQNFSLELTPVCGCSMAEAAIQASNLASTLGLYYIFFKGNGVSVTCCNDGSCMIMDIGGLRPARRIKATSKREFLEKFQEAIEWKEKGKRISEE